MFAVPGGLLIDQTRSERPDAMEAMEQQYGRAIVNTLEKKHRDIICDVKTMPSPDCECRSLAIINNEVTVPE